VVDSPLAGESAPAGLEGHVTVSGVLLSPKSSFAKAHGVKAILTGNRFFTHSQVSYLAKSVPFGRKTFFNFHSKELACRKVLVDIFV